MNKHPLYDVAVAEVRGEASTEEKKKLKENVFAWRDALQSVVDEVESQLVLKSEEFEDSIAWEEKYGTPDTLLDARNSYDVWKSRARTFKKHVSARLMAVKRLCQETVHSAGDLAFDLERALDVVTAALNLVDEEEADDSEWQELFERLIVASEAYRATLKAD